MLPNGIRTVPGY